MVIVMIWLNSDIIGFGQATATTVYQSTLESCYLLGGDTDLEVQL